MASCQAKTTKLLEPKALLRTLALQGLPLISLIHLLSKELRNTSSVKLLNVKRRTTTDLHFTRMARNIHSYNRCKFAGSHARNSRQSPAKVNNFPANTCRSRS